jgi:hypothetical protein
MRRRTVGLAVAAASLCGCLFVLAAPDSEDAAVPYPQGYRRWVHLHSTVIGPKHSALQSCEKPCTGGIFHFYANEKAMEGFRTGKFPDGAILADEVLETMQNESGNAASEGSRRGVGVMVKDSKRYSATGGWGFAKYARDSQTDATTAQERKDCFQCHVPKKDRDYVFTEYRER